MAVMLHTVSTFARGLARSSGAAARVFCGIDSTRLPKSNANSFIKDQDPPFSKPKTALVGFSHSTDLPARCQAATAVCPLPTRERPLRILELDAESTRVATIDQSAVPLPRSFLAESVMGTLVECSGRGSRPLYTNVLAGLTGMTEPEVGVPDRGDEFQAALANNPGDAHLVSEFAMFMWKSAGDVDAAEALFDRALGMAPDDPAIHANHALFLWQCED